MMRYARLMAASGLKNCFFNEVLVKVLNIKKHFVKWK